VKEDWQRWNDYGIGLLLQGDLKAAQAAFEKITEVDPQNPDGWLNIGRAALQEGDLPRARTVLDKALALNPSLARTNFFYGSLLKSAGDYDQPRRIFGSSLRSIRMIASRSTILGACCFYRGNMLRR